MNCTEVKYYLGDYVKGFLLDEVREEIHVHLNSCKSCVKIFDNLITAEKDLRSKKKNRSSEKNMHVKIPISNKKKNQKERDLKRNFSSASAISTGAGKIKNNFINKANEVENNKLFFTAGLISILALGVVLAFLMFDNSPQAFGSAEKITGYPVIESEVLTDKGIIRIGERLFTDSESRARLKAESIGEIDVEPESEIQIKETKSFEYRLVLSKGKINARTWSAPKLFSIKTPTAEIKDLGCLYDVFVDGNSTTRLNVKSGWVLMESGNKKSLLPEGTTCFSDRLNGLGTPFYSCASETFRSVLRKLDFEKGNRQELEILLSESRKRDLITLFHLLKNLDQESRVMIFDKIKALHDVSTNISREEVLAGNKETIGNLWVELGLGSISIYQNL